MSNFNLPCPSVRSGDPTGEGDFAVRDCVSRRSIGEEVQTGLNHVQSSTRVGIGPDNYDGSQHIQTQTSANLLQVAALSMENNCDPGYMRRASDVELLKTGSNITGYQRTPTNVSTVEYSKSHSKQVAVANGQYVGTQFETVSTGFNASEILPLLNGHAANGKNNWNPSIKRLPGGLYRGGQNSPRGGVPASYTASLDTQEISGELISNICSGTVVKEEHIQNLPDGTGQHSWPIGSLISDGDPVRNHSITSSRVVNYDIHTPVGTIASRNAKATAAGATPPQEVPALPHSSRAVQNRAMMEKQIARRSPRNRTPPTPPNCTHSEVYANPNFNDTNGIYGPPTAARRKTNPRIVQPGANEIDPSTGNPMTGGYNAVSPKVFPNRGSTPHTNPKAPPSVRASVSNPQLGKNRADPFSDLGFGGLVSVESAMDAMGRSLSVIRKDRNNPSPLGFADIPNPLFMLGTHEIAEPLPVFGVVGSGDGPVGFQGMGQPS